MACNKDHSTDLPRQTIEQLDTSQADFWRHKCAGCAYEAGKRDAEDRIREGYSQFVGDVFNDIMDRAKKAKR